MVWLMIFSAVIRRCVTTPLLSSLYKRSELTTPAHTNAYHTTTNPSTTLAIHLRVDEFLAPSFFSWKFAPVFFCYLCFYRTAIYLFVCLLELLLGFGMTIQHARAAAPAVLPSTVSPPRSSMPVVRSKRASFLKFRWTLLNFVSFG